MGKLESLKELPTCICLSYFSSGEERKNSRHVILISQVCRDLQSGLTHLCEVVNSSVLLFLTSACICVLQPCNPCNPGILLCLDKLFIPLLGTAESSRLAEMGSCTQNQPAPPECSADEGVSLWPSPKTEKIDGSEHSSFTVQGQYLACD